MHQRSGRRVNPAATRNRSSARISTRNSNPPAAKCLSVSTRARVPVSAPSQHGTEPRVGTSALPSAAHPLPLAWPRGCPSLRRWGVGQHWRWAGDGPAIPQRYWRKNHRKCRRKYQWKYRVDTAGNTALRTAEALALEAARIRQDAAACLGGTAAADSSPGSTHARGNASPHTPAPTSLRPDQRASLLLAVMARTRKSSPVIQIAAAV